MQSEKGEIIQDFLLHSPPGQISDVYNGRVELIKDIRGIIADKEELAQLVPTFETHNKEQLIPIKLPDVDYELILAPESHIGESLVYDPRTSATYSIDHMRQTATRSDEEGPVFDEKLSKARNAIDEAVTEYVAAYYPSGISSVFVSEDNIVIHIVGNKYNPNNFWAGRSRSSWTLSKSNLKGSIKAQIHYYEDGNVQLNTHKESSCELPSADPSEVVKQIQKVEAKFQIAINNAFADSAVATFKALRKALPITKTKIEWQAILACKMI
ncbi:hypothetical protein HDV06_000922 [Boothiomyces sp. JEL0866]|nr:hypothetical protein HDV06_000922 [Boothiomyces sp. JEL0866]